MILADNINKAILKLYCRPSIFPIYHLLTGNIVLGSTGFGVARNVTGYDEGLSTTIGLSRAARYLPL